MEHEARMSKHKWVDVEVLPVGRVVKVGRKLFLLTPSAQFLVRVKKFVKNCKRNQDECQLIGKARRKTPKALSYNAEKLRIASLEKTGHKP